MITEQCHSLRTCFEMNSKFLKIYERNLKKCAKIPRILRIYDKK